MTEPFVRVPRPLFDAVTRAKLPGSETRIALYLLGQSIGWQRSETEGYASIAAVARGSGCGRRTAIQAIRSLCARGLVVRVTRGGPGKGASSYKLAPASEWARTSEQDRTSKPQVSRTALANRTLLVSRSALGGGWSLVSRTALYIVSRTAL